MSVTSDVSYQKPNYRQAGKEKPGKLVKGFIHDGLNKSNSASIPYKFETILYENTNPRGFGQSAQRFFYADDMAPGPGSYNVNVQSLKLDGPSFSKKGLGNGFVSKSSRMLYRGYINAGPGPGSYDPVDKPFKVTHINPDTSTMSGTSRTTTTSYKPPVSDLPGPGQYHNENVITSTYSNPKQIRSVFRSTSERGLKLTNNTNPPPGAYNIDRSMIKKLPFKHFFGSATFQLPTKKKISEERAKRQLAYQLLEIPIPEQKSEGSPGPGAYFNKNVDEATLFNERIHDKPTSNFIVGNQTRFGEVIQKKAKRTELPGPGAYESMSRFNSEKSLVSGSVFMSETARKPFIENKHFIGPTKYNPELISKKSYHLNINKKWV